MIDLPQATIDENPKRNNASGAGLVDGYGRLHDNLRISVTDRCNLRCTYCMAEDVAFMVRDELLTFEEIAHFARLAASLGISKLRLTGGEPLLRRGIESLVRLLAAIPKVKDIGLTTNGLLLAQHAQTLFDAGLRRINISLDTLDPKRFRQLSRRDGLNHVLDGIEAAKKVGFQPIKINAVIIRGTNEIDVVPLARYARENEIELRFIEYMPIGAEPWQRESVFRAHEIMELIEGEICPLVPADEYDPSAPAMTFRYADGKGTMGIIASVSRPFCHSCNRLRLTADGKLRNCLFALNETDVKRYLRGQTDDGALVEAIRQSVATKWEGHEINSARFIKPQRTMHAIGG